MFTCKLINMSLFVGNLSKNVSYENLRDAFDPYGPCKVQRKVSPSSLNSILCRYICPLIYWMSCFELCYFVWTFSIRNANVKRKSDLWLSSCLAHHLIIWESPTWYTYCYIPRTEILLIGLVGPYLQVRTWEFPE